MRSGLLTFIEWLSVCALLLTKEVSWSLLFVWTGVWLAKTAIPFKCSDRVFLGVFFMVATSAGIYLLHEKVHPLLKAAYFVVSIHSTIWWSSQKTRQEILRLLLSLMTLLVAAAITPEFYLFFFIVVFMFCASLFLAIRHFESVSNALEEAPPRGYLLHTAVFSFFVLALTAVIFPLIPKSSELQHLDSGKSQVNYTENVDLSNWKKITGDGEGDVVLRVFFNGTSAKLHESLYWGLLRTRVLNSFNGTQWKPSLAGTSLRMKKIETIPTRPIPLVTLEVLRNEMESERLPVPYGTTGVWVDQQGSLANTIINSKSEWMKPATKSQQVKYNVVLKPNFFHAQFAPEDTPTNLDIAVPSKLRNGLLKKLSEKIFSGSKTAEEKIQAVRSFFPSEGFQAYIPGSENETAPKNEFEKYSALERFLFFEKKGHCELFSSATAVLLRMAGVPTRLVAGFRISRAGLAGVLNIRTGDAHAWVEAWSPRGWVVLDLTPRIVAGTDIFSKLESIYELLGAYWQNFIVNDTQGLIGRLIQQVRTISWKDEGESFFHWLGTVVHENMGVFVAILVLLIMAFFAGYAVVKAYFPQVFSIHYRVREGHALLKTRRRKFERWVDGSPHRMERGMSWLNEYERLRFGSRKALPSLEEVKKLDQIFQSLKGISQS